MKRLAIVILLALPWTWTALAAEPQSQRKTMPFDQCLTLIQTMGTQLGVAPVNIVETTAMRMVRFPATDGSVLMTCERPDTMILTRSSHKCGVSVKC
jgi:hypothetical protein